MSILKLKDSQGNWVGVPTIKGDKGNGISSAILNDDYTLTLTFTDGTTYKTPSIRGEKGEKGEPATDMDIHICSASEYDAETRMPTIANPNDKTFYLVPTEDGTSPDLFTEWVYVNNAWEMFGSMKIDLTDYVKNTDYATGAKAGVIKLNPNYGINVTDDGILYVNTAESKNAKMGTNNARPVTPIIQHESTFYGLAKASGDSTQSASSNAVGNYTNEAKSSIQNMLGITDKYSPKEWVAESETELVTNAHNIGDLFYIGETLYKVIVDLNAGDAINVGVNVEEVNANDILDNYATKEDVQDNVSIVEKSASGSIASFTDGADGLPLKSLVVNIDPVQDLHGYDSPWVGGGGKNLIYKTLKRVNIGADGKITSYNAYDVFCAKVESGKTYTISINGVATRSVDVGYFAEDPVLGSTTYDGNRILNLQSTFEATYTGFIGFRFDADTANVQIEEGSTATSYAPYENICPISGWEECEVNATGYNVWDEQWESGGYAYGNPSDDSSRIRSKNYISVVPNTTYFFKKGLNNGNMWAFFYDRNKVRLNPTVNGNNVGNSAVTTPDNCYYIRFFLSAQTEYQHDVTINYPSTDHDYHPYTGQSIPINWQTEAGTVYGGKLDVLTGKLTVEMGVLDMSTASWIFKSTTQRATTNDIKNLVKIPSSQFIKSGSIAENYTEVSSKMTLMVGEFAILQDGTVILYYDGVNAPSGKLVYPLAEPIEIQLTPNQVNSLLGVNNIWADSGDTSIEYFSQVDEDLVDYVEANLNSYAKKELLNNYIDDVQINGTSIVTDGVANVPLMTAEGDIGVARTDQTFGTSLYNKRIMVSKATDAQIKNPDLSGGYYKPIVPYNQHISTFYGLAKASGDATQSASSNVVGNYTDNAKDKIQTMLGVSPLIAPHESDPFESAHAIGELFIINGKLYKAKTALTVGEYVNEGTNVEVVDVAEVLDDYATKQEIENNINIVEKNSSGSIASFNDGADNVPIKSLVVDIDPVQNLNGYDSPWVGGIGKNLCDASQDNSIAYTSDYAHYSIEDGKVTTNGDTLMGFIVPVKSSTTYTFSLKKATTNSCQLRVRLHSGLPTGWSNAFISQPVNYFVDTSLTSANVTFETTAETMYAVCGIYVTGASLILSDFQVEEGSTATTYSPYENICPISGWTGCEVNATGKNLFDEENATIFKRYFQGQSGGVYRWAPINDSSSFVFKCKPNTTYTLKSNNPNVTIFRVATINVSIEESENVTLNQVSMANKPRTITTDADATYIVIQMNNSIASTKETQLQIELGDRATEYEPYTGRSITISWADEAGTVYGGKLDVLSGVLRVEMAMVDLGTLGWNPVTSGGKRVFYSELYDAPKKSTFYGICSKYKRKQSAPYENNTFILYGSTDFSRVGIRDDMHSASDGATFRESLSGAQLVYELAEPIEIQLTPHEVNSLLGVNSIFADTGDTEVEYFSQVNKDLIDYIETSLKPYAKEERLNDYVSDVRINGTSIVENGIGNIPIATNNVLGAVYTASESDTKVGSHTYRAVVPKVQHSSTFYGLAKAAGVDMSTSSNAVGTYTEEAKTAIKQMLGVHDTIDSFVEEVTGTDVTITGQPSYRYNCGEVLSLTVTPPETGTIDFRFTSGSTPTVLTLPSTVKMPEWWVEVEANTIYEMCITDGVYCGVMSWAM